MVERYPKRLIHPLLKNPARAIALPNFLVSFEEQLRLKCGVFPAPSILNNVTEPASCRFEPEAKISSFGAATAIISLRWQLVHQSNHLPLDLREKTDNSVIDPLDCILNKYAASTILVSRNIFFSCT